MKKAIRPTELNNPWFQVPFNVFDNGVKRSVLRTTGPTRLNTQNHVFANVFNSEQLFILFNKDLKSAMCHSEKQPVPPVSCAKVGHHEGLKKVERQTRKILSNK